MTLVEEPISSCQELEYRGDGEPEMRMHGSWDRPRRWLHIPRPAGETEEQRIEWLFGELGKQKADGGHG